ncbi:unnamed protein product [Caenorhabditis sp. 36 PRJEB53466]|nr:unnamed protein product [Caenorhabditis sp. 36 PRJEB53466]
MNKSHHNYMHCHSILALFALVYGASAQCFGGGGGCFLPPPPCSGCGCGNECGPQVTLVQIPSNNGCSCSPCFQPICPPRCNSCPPPPIIIGLSSCCNDNNFSCCGFRHRRHLKAKETIEAVSNATKIQE